MNFLIHFPVFVISKGQDFPLILADGVPQRAIAVFTDQVAAEEFRDENYSGGQWSKFLTTSHLEQFLLFIRKHRRDISYVTFDPYKSGMMANIISINEFLNHLTQKDETSWL